MSNLYDRLLKKEAKLAVIGLGYVGLPIALGLRPQDQGRRLRHQPEAGGHDAPQRGSEQRAGSLGVRGLRYPLHADLEDLRDVEFFIVAVPTPIDSRTSPTSRRCWAPRARWARC
jgi:UDP-N-acetyl-D-galactosamine dehydrogenase